MRAMVLYGLFLCLGVMGCGGSTAVVVTPPVRGAVTPSPTAVFLVDEEPTAEGMTTMEDAEAVALLARVGETLARVETLSWRVAITGQEGEQVVEQTITDCAVRLPDEAYCATEVVARFGDAVGEEGRVELWQNGGAMRVRLAGGSWQMLGGATRPESVVLHELLIFEGGVLRFVGAQGFDSAVVVGRETINGVETTIVSAVADLTNGSGALQERLYGTAVEPRGAAATEQRLTSRLWIGTADGRLYQSVSAFETGLANGDTAVVNFETMYSGYDEPVEMPEA